jgi:hypothetical protein
VNDRKKIQHNRTDYARTLTADQLKTVVGSIDKRKREIGTLLANYGGQLPDDYCKSLQSWAQGLVDLIASGDHT